MKLALSLLLVKLFSFAHASDIYVWDWEVTEGISKPLTINPLSYTNRAQCAIDSENPTKSIVLLLDSVNPGKSFYRVAQRLGVDTDKTTTLGIEKYRYTVTKLTEIIIGKLLKGEIPLIKANIDQLASQAFQTAIKDCKNINSCVQYNEILREFWTFPKRTLKTKYGLDDGDFLDQKNSKLGCYFIKKFSPIQGHFQISKPTPKSGQLLAETIHKLGQNMVQCDDIDNQENLKVANYQFDITNISDELWNKVGFDFWHSVKLYLSWAQKFSKEVDIIAQPFQRLIKSVALEETLLFIPNGCKSLIEPKCDAAAINLNSMRSFTQIKNEKELLKTDYMSQFSSGQEGDLISTPIVDVNKDILEFNSYENADKWAENFRNNYTKARGFFKLKFMGAINNLKLIKSNLTVDQLQYEMLKTAKSEQEILKNEVYYLCSEFKIATDEKFSFLNKDLKLLSNATVLDDLSAQIGGEKIKNYFDYFTQIKTNVLETCNQLERNNYWGDGYSVDREGFTAWFQEHTMEKKLPFKNNITRKLSRKITPILTLSKRKEFSKAKDVICVEGANCARIILDSIIDLYSSLKYADSMLVSNDIKYSQMGNPYAERKACNIYDPWRRKRAVVKQFFHDLGRAAFFGLVPTPVYISTEVKDKKVTTLNALMKDGKISFDPEFDAGEVRRAFMADFGPMLGVPCAISISKSTFNPLHYYQFNGVSVGACNENQSFQTTARSADDISSGDRASSQCFSCAINLTTVGSVAANINPIVRSAFILIRGVYNFFKGIRDPHDIPRSYSLNPNQVYDVYRRWGTVNKYCMKKLLKGKACLKNKCEDSLVRNTHRLLTGNITGTYAEKRRYNGFVKLDTCEEPITMKIRDNKLRRRKVCSPKYQAHLDDFIIPESCRKTVLYNVESVNE